MTEDVLGEANAAKALKLVDAFFPSVNVPDFKKGGRLWVVLKIAAASLLKHYHKALKLGNN
jgi:hypothetical protein